MEIEAKAVRICGVDEAGRGPLAGPVYAAAVVLGDGFPTEVLDDSKRLSPARRLAAERIIKERALAWAVALATREEIDALNILQATMLAMRRAVGKLDASLFGLVLVDGDRVPSLPCPARPVVGGDALVPEIMAASILAKTERDRIMDLCAVKWPGYGFERHKGYPTALHKARLRELGPCPIHRRSFRY